MDGQGKPAQSSKSRGCRKGHACINKGPSSGRSTISWREGMTRPAKFVYEIYCSNYGIEKFCDTVFRSMRPRAILGITVDHLRYVTSLAYFWRCIRIAQLSGYSPLLLQEVIDLQRCISDIRLPEVLCTYIECLGIFETSMGIVVGPWVAKSAAEWYDQVGMWSPEVFLNRLGLQGSGSWFINSTVYCKWLNATICPSYMRIRQVNFDNSEGTVSMIASYRNTPPSPTFEGTSLIAMTDMESQLGAAYQWRNTIDSNRWPGDTSMLCSFFQRSEYFNVECFLSSLVRKSMDYSVNYSSSDSD
ncbi:uncharacterized protein [Halyomorpha halys]|uniref:uncharacterized protein n=1 Tax=Halyomorpha halys TaxID=286706 RepID=UPI0006D4DFD0|nr:uncharacterized protein LOC106691803 isoform X1 [Halyomorpha halys]XP_014293180.1 uncharacterized protein LOC106691803 isoform X1 [Halyomorpha halys]